jgi:hypothetical protein
MNPSPVAPPLARPVPHSAGKRPAPAPRHKSRSSRSRRRLRNEGFRGTSTRASVWMRYGSYWFVIVLSGAVAHLCFRSVPGARSGGTWLMASSAFQLIVAVLGTIFAAHRRTDIIEQLRAFLFGYTVGPGLGVAVFMWTTQALVEDGSDDLFVRTAIAALPWLYFIPVVVPAIMYLKLVSGFRALDRVQLDDEEILQIYTRNDGLQR